MGTSDRKKDSKGVGKKKDPYLPPTRPIPKEDPYLPTKEEGEEIYVTPEVISPTERFSHPPSLEDTLRDLLGMTFRFPRDKTAFGSYMTTIPERLRLHGHQKLAEKMVKSIEVIKSAQEAKCQLLRLLVDEKYTQKAERKEWEAYISELEAREAEAKKRKRLAEED